MSKFKIAVSIVAIAAAGILTGLLIAPQKGKKLRKRLRKKANYTKDKLCNLFPSKKAVEETQGESAYV
ncbi:MAG: YtxH domain-containing protein [Chitinophagaceae bacterium]